MSPSVDRIRKWPLSKRVVRPATIASLTVPGCGKFATRGLPPEQRIISGPLRRAANEPRYPVSRRIRLPGENTEGGQFVAFRATCSRL